MFLVTLRLPGKFDHVHTLNLEPLRIPPGTRYHNPLGEDLDTDFNIEQEHNLDLLQSGTPSDSNPKLQSHSTQLPHTNPTSDPFTTPTPYNYLYTPLYTYWSSDVLPAASTPRSHPSMMLSAEESAGMGVQIQENILQVEHISDLTRLNHTEDHNRANITELDGNNGTDNYSW